jgi:hypothetical protein
MKRSSALSLIFFFSTLLSAGAWADHLKVYKWTDAQGLLHYSDKPPLEATADMQTLQFDLPPVDTEKLAASEAAMARLAAEQRQQQAEEDLEQQRRQLAEQQAELAATLATLQQSAAATAQPQQVFYAAAPSRFIPRHHEPDRDDFKRMPQAPKSVVPTWPFPYNLSASSFPEEQHRP